MARIHPNWQAERVLGVDSPSSFCWWLGERGLFLVPAGGERFAAGTPAKWLAPNGVEVWVLRKGRVNHFHRPAVGAELEETVDFATLAVAKHRHMGPARHALRAFAREFVVDPCVEAFRLRQLVRQGD